MTPRAPARPPPTPAPTESPPAPLAPGDSAVTRDDLRQLLGPTATPVDAVLRILGEAADRGRIFTRTGDPDAGARLDADLRLLPPAALLHALMQQGRTGVLVVLGVQGQRALFLDGGAYTGCASTLKADRLGEVLWRRGKISLDQLLIAEQTMEPGMRLGRVLVDLGYLAAAELYKALHGQAVAVLQEACLQLEGAAVFLAGLRLRQPMVVPEAADVLVEAAAQARESRALLAELAPLDARVVAADGFSGRPLTEAETAMLQLASSSRPPLSRGVLLERVELGRLEGLRTLTALLHDGWLESTAAPAAPPPAPPPDELLALCGAVNDVLHALAAAGFGAADDVNAFIADPPAAHRRWLGLLDLDDGKLDPDAVRGVAEGVHDGREGLVAALRALLDFAMFQAHDTLDADTYVELVESIRAAAIPA